MKVESAQRLVDAVQALSSAESIEGILASVCPSARSINGADGATLVLRDREQCYYADEDAIRPLWKGERFPLTACISGWVMLNGRPALIGDIYADERIPHAAYRPTFVTSLAMVPVRTSSPIAAIGNYWAERDAPDAEAGERLGLLADAVAGALERVGYEGSLAARLRVPDLRRDDPDDAAGRAELAGRG